MTMRAQFYQRVAAGEMENTVEAYEAFVKEHQTQVLMIEGDPDPNGDRIVNSIHEE
jgi:hypothetical protein